MELKNWNSYTLIIKVACACSIKKVNSSESHEKFFGKSFESFHHIWPQVGNVRCFKKQ